jgi:hypothetical protein
VYVVLGNLIDRNIAVPQGSRFCIGITSKNNIFQNVDTELVHRHYFQLPGVEPAVLQTWRARYCQFMFLPMIAGCTESRCSVCKSAAHNLSPWITANERVNLSVTRNNSRDVLMQATNTTPPVQEFTTPTGTFENINIENEIPHTLLIQFIDSDSNARKNLLQIIDRQHETGNLSNFISVQLNGSQLPTPGFSSDAAIETEKVFIVPCQQLLISHLQSKFNLTAEQVIYRADVYYIKRSPCTIFHQNCEQAMILRNASRQPRAVLCRNCRILSGKMEKMMDFSNTSPDQIIKSKTNTRYMSKNMMQTKLAAFGSHIKASNQREQRLRKKIAELLLPDHDSPGPETTKVLAEICQKAVSENGVAEIV